MVDRTRELEKAMGSADKYITGNEKDTTVVQRRCVRAARGIKAGETLSRDMLDVLRPATKGAIKPAEIDRVVGTRALTDLPFGKEIRWTDLGA
jgi:sialic acid synthase SpsE